MTRAGVREVLITLACGVGIANVRRFRRWVGGHWSLVQTQRGSRVWIHGVGGWVPYTPFAPFTLEVENYDAPPMKEHGHD